MLPESVHMVTRRCVGRRFLLRPSPTVNEVVKYALLRAADLTGVTILNALFESNHCHACVYDPHARLPDFERELDSLVARALNAHYGRGEAFWAPGSYSNVELYGPETVIDKLTYVLCNPVQDGLVERPEDWPGFKILPEEVGTTLVVKRPDGAFFGGRRGRDYEPTYAPARRRFRRLKQEEERRTRRLRRLGKLPAPENDKRRRYRERPSKLPEVVSTRIGIPPMFSHYTPEEFRKLLRERLEERLQKIYALRRELGLKRFLGAQAVLAQDPFGSAGSTSPSFRLDPRISALHRPRRIMELLKLKQWREAYRQGLKVYRRERSAAVFPYGTYLLRVRHGVRTEEPAEQAA